MRGFVTHVYSCAYQRALEILVRFYRLKLCVGKSLEFGPCYSPETVHG